MKAIEKSGELVPSGTLDLPGEVAELRTFPSCPCFGIVWFIYVQFPSPSLSPLGKKMWILEEKHSIVQ